MPYGLTIDMILEMRFANRRRIRRRPHSGQTAATHLEALATERLY